MDAMDIMTLIESELVEYLVWAWNAGFVTWEALIKSCLGYQGHGQSTTLVRIKSPLFKSELYFSRGSTEITFSKLFFDELSHLKWSNMLVQFGVKCFQWFIYIIKTRAT